MSKAPATNPAPACDAGGNATASAAVASRGRLAMICLALGVTVWVVFGQTLRHEFINFDDPEYVFDNPIVRRGLSLEGVRWAFTHVHGANWHPVTTLSHMLDCQLYGLHPGGHHFNNVLLHMATVVLLFLVLHNMTGAMWRSAFVAAVFAIHPLRVESVAWVAERKDVLSGFFFMLTLWAYVRYARKTETERRASCAISPALSSPPYWLVVLCFALGLMSKPMLVTLPFVLLLLDYWPLQRFQLTAFNVQWLRRHSALLTEKIPLLVLAALAVGVTLLAQRQAIEMVQAVTLPARAGNALISYGVYLGQVLYPAGLSVLYPHPGNHPPVWKIGAATAALLILSVLAVRGRQKRPWLLVGWLWFLGMLLPVIGLIQVGSQAHADRYTYLPHIGLYLMAAWSLADYCGSNRRLLLGVWLAAGLVLASLMAAAFQQATCWKDSVSLWSHTLACTKNNPVAVNLFGNALDGTGKAGPAIQYYQESLRLKPDYSDAHLNLANALARQRKFDEAIIQYEQTLRFRPDCAEAHYGLGVVRATLGQADQAIRNYEQALRCKPDYPAALGNLGAALAAQGKLTGAISHLERALELDPDDAMASYNMGNAMIAVNQPDQAVGFFERALRLNPAYSEAHNNLASLLAAQGRWSAAAEHYEKALRGNSSNAEARFGLGNVLFQMGNKSAAGQQFEAAAKLADSQGNAPLAEASRARMKACGSPSH